MAFPALLAWLLAHSVLLVLATFLMIVIATYWPGRRAKFQRDAMIPLRDDR